MLADNELISLLLCLGILAFFWANLARIRQLSGYRPMLWGFLAYLVATIFTLLESYIWPDGFNFLEHVGYLASAVCLAAWVAKLTGFRQGAG